MNAKKGFTLIELLLVISIMAILSTLALVTLASVRNDARESRTQALIARIRSTLQEKLDSFETRQLPFDFQRDFFASPPTGLQSDLIPNLAQQQFIFKRTLCEWIRSEMPVNIEDLAAYPSIQSRVPNPSPTLRPGLPVVEEYENYWPDMPGGMGSGTGEWVSIYTDLLVRRVSPSFLKMNQRVSATYDRNLDSLVQGSLPFPFPYNDALYPYKENYSGWDGNVVPGVVALSYQELAWSVIESSEMLYLILDSTYDRDGNRGTSFLRSDDVADLNENGLLEIVDGAGYPLVFSMTVNNVGQDGIPVDRNGDSFFDFRDNFLDPRLAPDPNDYQIHLGSIGFDSLPPQLRHLMHLRNDRSPPHPYSRKTLIFEF